MNNNSIDYLLDRLRQRDLPPSPDLRREVRAEIARLKARPSFWKGLLPVLHWNELLLQPRVAACAFALALVVGVTPGIVGVAIPSRAQNASYARASLHLDVFNANMGSLSQAAASLARHP